MTAPKPLTEWQAANLPKELPRHIRRSIEEGPDGCWLWMRSKSRDGYGWTSLNDKTYQAHRLVFSILCFKPPPDMVIDHLCRVRHCVKPGHMEIVTPGENIRRSELTPAGMKKCGKCGGEFSIQRRQRRCLPCQKNYLAEKAESRKAYLKEWRMKNKTKEAKP